MAFVFYHVSKRHRRRKPFQEIAQNSGSEEAGHGPAHGWGATSSGAAAGNTGYGAEGTRQEELKREQQEQSSSDRSDWYRVYSAYRRSQEKALTECHKGDKNAERVVEEGARESADAYLRIKHMLKEAESLMERYYKVRNVLPRNSFTIPLMATIEDAYKKIKSMISINPDIGHFTRIDATVAREYLRKLRNALAQLEDYKRSLAKWCKDWANSSTKPPDWDKICPRLGLH